MSVRGARLRKYATLAGLAGKAAGHGAHAALQQRLILWVHWLLAEFVVPLLRAHFYCTESEAYRQEVLYYRCCPNST